jgi:asparagine synthase (glutamine-hydrolysing)
MLHNEDRVSMAVSLESRVPLLDYRIVQYLATVPPEQKVRGLQPKYLLRRVASSLLPERVWKRKDKFPFPVPAKFWLSKEMNGMANRVLLSPESLNRGIFKPQVLRDAINNVRTIGPLINTELWFKIFIDKNPNWPCHDSQ